MVPSIWFSISVVEVVLVVEGMGNDDVSARDSGVGKVRIFQGQMSKGVELGNGGSINLERFDDHSKSWGHPDDGWVREYYRGKYHCTIDLLFYWFGLVCYANIYKICQLSYSWFQTSQTGGQRYSDTSPFSIPRLVHQTFSERGAVVSCDSSKMTNPLFGGLWGMGRASSSSSLMRSSRWAEAHWNQCDDHCWMDN